MASAANFRQCWWKPRRASFEVRSPVVMALSVSTYLPLASFLISWHSSSSRTDCLASSVQTSFLRMLDDQGFFYMTVFDNWGMGSRYLCAFSTGDGNYFDHG